MAFETSTRLKFVQIPTLTKPTGGGVVSTDLPKVGILAGIMLPLSVVISGTLSAPNALGNASAIRRVSLSLNSGHRLIDISGAGYHYLLRDMLNLNDDMLGWTDARAAVTTGTKRLDMYLPVSLNMRDEVGLIMLQNEATLATLSIDFEADATVATGATITGSVTPELVVFEVPTDPANLPNMSALHQIVEEQVSISGAIDYDHQIARGATLVGQYYLFPPGFTRASLIVQQSNTVEQLTVDNHRLRFALTHGRDLTLAGALTGTDKRVLFDFAGTDGLGQFGTIRDVIDTNRLTSIFTRITAVGAGTLTAVRRQIVPLS